MSGAEVATATKNGVEISIMCILRIIIMWWPCSLQPDHQKASISSIKCTVDLHHMAYAAYNQCC